MFFVQPQQTSGTSIQPYTGIIGGLTGTADVSILLISVCVPEACRASDFFGALGLDMLCLTKEENDYFTSGDIGFL